MSTTAGRSLSEMLRRDAISETLEVEANLQRHFVRSLSTLCRNAAHPLLRQLVEHNPRAFKAPATCEYWKWNGPPGNTATAEIRRFLEPIVAAECQPIFAVASLSTVSADPTIFLPVPYGRDPFDFNRFKDALWVNAPDGAFEPKVTDAAEPAARVISHALLNVSYSVHLNDEPTHGWLAWAHQSGTAIYVPRVNVLATSLELAQQGSPEVLSVSRREEVFLGMASVLYVPVHDYSTGTPSGVSAVAMLWSPIPGRWDGCFDQTTIAKETPEHIGTNDAFRLPQFEDDAVRRVLWDRFGWLGAVADRDRSDKRKAELELLSFILAMESWSEQHSSVTKSQFNAFFHGTLDLLHQLESEQIEWLSVRQWIDDMVRDNASFVKSLISRWQKLTGRFGISLDDVPLRLTVGRHDKVGSRNSTFLLGQRDAEDTCIGLLSDISPQLCIGFQRYIAANIAEEPAANISVGAERLCAIEVDVTKRYAIVRYFEVPRSAQKQHFTGSREAFEQYYAARRGLAVPRGDGSGLGLWLYQVYEARTRVSRKLYVSADAEEWYTQIAIPVETVAL